MTATKVRFFHARFRITHPVSVYNFWEPLHFFDRGSGFQTWEVAPQYAIRSWAYILLHFLPTRIVPILVGREKVPHLPFRLHSTIS